MAKTTKKHKNHEKKDRDKKKKEKKKSINVFFGVLGVLLVIKTSNMLRKVEFEATNDNYDNIDSNNRTAREIGSGRIITTKAINNDSENKRRKKKQHNSTNYNSNNNNNVLLELSKLTNNPINGTLDCQLPAVPIYDLIVNDNKGTTKNFKIPPFIHVSFKSRCGANFHVGTMKKWQEAFPNYNVYYHDDDAVNRLLYEEDWSHLFPDLKNLLQNCVTKKGAMVVDIWRLLVIYKYGGVYSDIDNRPDITFNHDVVLHEDDEAIFLSDVWNRPSQWFFAMEPKHPIIVHSINTILKNLYKMPNIGRVKVVFVTGPHALKEGYQRFLNTEYQHIWFNTGVYIGDQNKTVRKIRTKALGFSKGSPVSRYDDKDREEVFNITGVDHWYKEKFQVNKDDYTGSCKSYLSKYNIVLTKAKEFEKIIASDERLIAERQKK